MLPDDEIAKARARTVDAITEGPAPPPDAEADVADATPDADIDDMLRRQRLMDEAVAELRASGRISVR